MKKVGASIRRQDLVAAAVKVIAAHGVSGATTRKIAEAAKCPLASLHYVFNSKEELFYEVFESMFADVELPSAEPQASEPLEDVAARLLRDSICWLVENPDFAHAQSELYNWSLRAGTPMARRSYEMALGKSSDYLVRFSHPPVERETADVIARLCVALNDGFLLSWFAFDDLARLEFDLDTACNAVRAFVRTYGQAGSAPATAVAA